jgi:hypothetical protein
MEPRVGTTEAQEKDARKRKSAGWVVAVLVFFVAYAIMIASDHTWGVALGWLPSGFIAAAFGWLVYCFPWLLEIIALLLEALSALG